MGFKHGRRNLLKKAGAWWGSTGLFQQLVFLPKGVDEKHPAKDTVALRPSKALETMKDGCWGRIWPAINFLVLSKFIKKKNQ